MDLLAQMATFVRVVEAGSLSAAARDLRLSPAAVSRQLGDLEARLGGALVRRTTRALAVTDAGRRYYAECVRLLRELDEAGELVREGAAVRGQLTVSAPVTFGLARVWPALPALLGAHPGLRVDLRLEDRVIDLVADNVDVAIRVSVAMPDSASLVAHELARYERLVVAAPSYLRRRGTPKTPEALASHEALVHASGGGGVGAWRLARGGREVVVRPEGAVRTNALYVLRDAAVRGLGVALLPTWLVDDELASGALRALLRDWAAPAAAVVAVHRTELRGVARVRALLDHLRAAWQPAP
ncbi:MAG TPA: LysR family transcriptional regulator [Polyangiaceae bacterium]|nr:LysR family transcriptional regulator [Polyangiaceae bacterium]